MLIVVRHAMPVVDPVVPPELWALSPEGAVAAARLAERLPVGALVVSSEEPKAIGTAEVLAGEGGRLVVDPRLGEVIRDEPFEGDFRARRRAYVEGVGHPGWEPQDAVARRVDAAVSEHGTAAAAAGAALVLVGHGMAFTVWLHAHGHVSSPGAFWADLRLPDAFSVDVDRDIVARL